MKTSISAIVVVTALAQNAMADDPPAGGGAGGDAAAGAAVGTGDPAAAAAPAPDAAAPATRYPRSVIDRVLTYPAGLAVGGLDIVNSTSAFFDPAIMRVLGGYGINDDLELNFAAYTFTTASGKGSIDAGVGYKLARGAMGGKLEVIGRAQLGYSLASEGLNPFALGAHVQYNVTPKICLITPGGQLVIAVDPDTAVSLALPVGVGFQATPELYVQLDTTLANIGISPSGSTFIGADSTPIAITATYNVMPPLDVLVGLALNLTPPDLPPVPPATMGTEQSVGDTLAILVGARYYVGKL
jgi:hypothetical protein